MQTIMQKPPFGVKDKFGYALGDFGCNLSFSLISAFMFLFYTQYIGISYAAWSIIIIGIKIWDAINDPIMGGLMDSVKLKGGKFKPWIKIGSFGLIVGGAIVFLPIPHAPQTIKIIVCVFTYLFWDVCYTILNVPYGAFNAAITADPAGRASLSTWRSVGAGIGGLVSMLLPVLVYDKDNNLLGGRFIWIGLVMGVFAFFSFYGLLKMTNERVEVPREEKKFNYFKAIKGFFTNRAALGVSLASFALIVFFLSNAITMPLVFQSYFKNAPLLSAANILIYLPLAATVPFVGRIVRKFGKKISAGVPFIFSSVLALVMIFVPMRPDTSWGPWVYIIGMMLIQFGGGIFQLVCWAMVADCIDYQYMRTGERDEGSVYAIYSLFRKIAQGVCASLIPLTMVWAGYDEDKKVDQLPKVAENMKNVSFLLILIGSIIMALSVLLVYNLGRKEVEEISKNLGKSAEIDVGEAMRAAKD
jgi:sugar (Glycoside-Pentoside-Hexuronide) transporter